MTTFHGYLLLKQPGTIALRDWAKLPLGLRTTALNAKPDDPQPAKRLHHRTSLDGSEIILEAAFDERDLSPSDTTRLPKYLGDVMGLPVLQVKGDIVGKVSVFAAGKDWDTGRRAALQYITANLANWEPPEDDLAPKSLAVRSMAAVSGPVVAAKNRVGLELEWILKRSRSWLRRLRKRS